MATEGYLCLKEFRVRCPQEVWEDGRGLWFAFPFAGTGEFVSGSVRQRLAVGDVLVAKLADGARISPLSGSELILRCFCVALETLFPLLAGCEIPHLRGISETFRTGKVFPTNGRLASRCHALLGQVPPEVNIEHRTLLLRIVAVLLSPELTRRSQEYGVAKGAGQQVRELFERLSIDDFTKSSVNELTREFHVSRRHFNRLFRAHFGVSIGALRIEARLNRALSLLRDPDAKIINVAEEAGFTHLGAFNTCFRRRFGTSPSQWRRTVVRPLGEETPVAHCRRVAGS